MPQSSLSTLRARLLAAGLALSAIFPGGCAVAPEPFTAGEFKEHGERDLKGLFEHQDPVTDAIDLYQAMGRAVAFNLDYRVKALEEALARGNLARAEKDMLPQLLASAGYTGRNNDNISVSKTLSTGVTSTDPSTSQDKDLVSAELVFVWNLLDFGVAYTQAQQVANEAIIADERRRRSLQNIVQDIRQAYFRAVSAERLLPEMDRLLARVEAALAQSRGAEKARVQDPAKNLEYQQELLETVQQLWAMRRDLSLAKTELANLMNLKPGVAYAVALPAGDFPPLPPPEGLSAAELERTALSDRPEVRIEAYQGRVSALEVRKAMLRMLPGLELSLGANYDGNSYLLNNTWAQVGGRLSWNALSLLAGPAAVEAAELQEKLAAERHLFMSMMVLTQVNLALQRYHLAGRDLAIAAELAEVLERRFAHAQAARKAKKGGELDEIRQQAALLAARMRHGVALAEYQAAFGRIMNSTGADPLPEGYADPRLGNLARALREQETNLLARFIKADKADTPPPAAIIETTLEPSPPRPPGEEDAPAAPGQAPSAVLPPSLASSPQSLLPPAPAKPRREVEEPVRVLLNAGHGDLDARNEQGPVLRIGRE